MALPLTIDTHAHYFPESYLKLIADHGQRCGTTVSADATGTRFIQVGLLLRTGPITREFTDLDDRLKTMDAMGVRMHALSLTQPMVYWADDDLAVRLCVAFNDAVSRAHRLHPERFIGFACLQFWTSDASEVANAFTYGGNTVMQYPLTIFPGEVVTGLTLLVPLAFVNWYPSLYILDRPDPFGFPAWLQFASPIVAVLLGTLALLAWRTGVRHYASTGS